MPLSIQQSPYRYIGISVYRRDLGLPVGTDSTKITKGQKMQRIVLILLVFASLLLKTTGIRFPLSATSLFISKDGSDSNQSEERVKIQRTFVAIKPDAIERGLVGEIIHRLERKGMKMVAVKMVRPCESLVEKHYAAHKGKSFYPDLVKFFTSAPVIAMVWEGNYAVRLIRGITGETNPEDAVSGTIRGDYCFQRGRTLIHSSDSVESAQKEIQLWFTKEEIME